MRNYFVVDVSLLAGTVINNLGVLSDIFELWNTLLDFDLMQGVALVWFASHLSCCCCSDILTYKVVQIWPGQTVTCSHTISPGHIWTTLYITLVQVYFA
jgi:uncharacterized membrane protein